MYNLKVLRILMQRHFSTFPLQVLYSLHINCQSVTLTVLNIKKEKTKEHLQQLVKNSLFHLPANTHEGIGICNLLI